MSNPTQSSYHVEREPARGRRRVIIAAIAAAVLLTGGGAAYAATRSGSSHHGHQSSSRTLFINGHITADPSTFMRSYHLTHPYEPGCAPDTGYTDLPGAQVVVTDDAGHTLAVGHLDQGSYRDDECSFAFTVAGIPAGRKFYGITVSHRGTLTYTEAQLTAGPLDLSLR
jgi:hypothetical protein